MRGVDRFVQARHYRKGRTAPARLWVVHDMEAPERIDTAESCARFFATTSVVASANVCADSDSLVGSVDWDDTAWHAPGVNYESWGVEHAGYARQIRAEWLDPYGVLMLDRSARLFVEVGLAAGIPAVRVGPDEIRAGASGICGHWDVTKAFPERGDGHWDPGPEFPWDWFLDRIASYVGAPVTTGPPPPAPEATEPVVSRVRNSTHPLVREVQGYLAELGFDPGPVDGIFGASTERAVLAFQARGLDLDGNPLAVDGIVGPKTLASLRTLIFVARAGTPLPPAPAPRPEVPPFPGRLLSAPATGPDVRMAQQRLADRGWAITVDGIYGDQTAGIVRQFQAEKGLLVDGVIGPETWTALWAAPVT